jgi:hypothetical protein
MGRATHRGPARSRRAERPHMISRAGTADPSGGRDEPTRGIVPSPDVETVPAEDPNDPRRDVLAVVLTDGTIQVVADPAVKETHRPRWRNGRLRGPGWTMWWELRSYEDEPPA